MPTQSARILVVDDESMNREYLSAFIREMGHAPTAVCNGEEALLSLASELPDMIITDMMMPVMDGQTLLTEIRKNEQYRHIPVLVISSFSEMDMIAKCIELGAEDYLLKPFNITIFMARIRATLERKWLRDQEQAHQELLANYNAQLEQRVYAQVSQITSYQRATLFAMARLAESRDDETGHHLNRVEDYCRALCLELAMMDAFTGVITHEFVEFLCASCSLHDIGKVGIPDCVLLKPGKLTEQEYALMKEHTTIGAETLHSVDQEHPGNTFLQFGIHIAQSHHERWNGTGYPAGLAEEEIPLAARIVTMADVYDALISKRCYKEAFTHNQSRAIILSEKGKMFDPRIVEAFLHCEDKFLAISQQLSQKAEAPYFVRLQQLSAPEVAVPADPSAS